MKPLDRSGAVNLARNVAERRVTQKGMKTLADAVIAMDAELSRLYRVLNAAPQVPVSASLGSGEPVSSPAVAAPEYSRPQEEKGR
jgi:hypothetical protein